MAAILPFVPAAANIFSIGPNFLSARPAANNSARHAEMLLSVDQAGAWKPAAQSYRYALDRCGVEPHEAMLVAVHPWDIDGAHRAGLSTAWINRTGTTYPQHFTAPDLVATSLLHLEKLLQPAT
ncbi:(S)-2-haloacid dehalogenase 4A [Rhodococcus fascians]|nr:(S)-2-haloacid dehalogenase 4A [Rhodococcus fascians]